MCIFEEKIIIAHFWHAGSPIYFTGINYAIRALFAWNLSILTMGNLDSCADNDLYFIHMYHRQKILEKVSERLKILCTMDSLARNTIFCR